MNLHTKLKNRNEVKSTIDLNHRNRNCLKFSAGESDEHIQMKLEICKWLARNKKEYYTEAVFESGGRCDVINSDDQIIYEVFNTESEKSMEIKAKKYPFEVRFVDANQKFKEEILQ